MLGRTMNMDDAISEEELAALEVTLPTALELCRLGLASMIDIRQTFEIEMKGAIPDSVHIPLFEVKRMLGHTLTEDEQDILDAGKPSDIDVQGFFTMINRLHHAHDNILLPHSYHTAHFPWRRTVQAFTEAGHPDVMISVFKDVAEPGRATEFLSTDLLPCLSGLTVM